MDRGGSACPTLQEGLRLDRSPRSPRWSVQPRYNDRPSFIRSQPGQISSCFLPQPSSSLECRKAMANALPGQPGLSEDLIIQILRHLDPKDIAMMRAVSSSTFFSGSCVVFSHPGFLDLPSVPQSSELQNYMVERTRPCLRSAWDIQTDLPYREHDFA